MITILIAQDEKKVKEIITQVLREEGYGFPGNSALQNKMINIVSKDSSQNINFLKDTVIELEDALYEKKEGMLYKTVLETVEKPLIEHALKKSDGNQLKAARILGMNRNTIRAKIKKLGIDVNRWKE